MKVKYFFSKSVERRWSATLFRAIFLIAILFSPIGGLWGLSAQVVCRTEAELYNAIVHGEEPVVTIDGAITIQMVIGISRDVKITGINNATLNATGAKVWPGFGGTLFNIYAM
ncbi:MAG: hypothetical protein LBR66_09095 [Candidatus Symbiothrix sp.]|jgi:hypothetical protein|nr:hypothetical protein [Candidatus Symbiothrix sp.]